MKVYGVIMAGGGGTRFWPLSRQKRPKQLLNLSGKDLMINETIDRIHRFIDYEDIFIVTNQTQAEAMKQAVAGRVREENILSEPAARNTAACIGYAAEVIEKRYGSGIMCVFPADHYIKDEKEFGRLVLLLHSPLQGMVIFSTRMIRRFLTRYFNLLKNPIPKLLKNILQRGLIFGTAECLYGKQVQYFRK